MSIQNSLQLPSISSFDFQNSSGENLSSLLSQEKDLLKFQGDQQGHARALEMQLSIAAMKMTEAEKAQDVAFDQFLKFNSEDAQSQLEKAERAFSAAQEEHENLKIQLNYVQSANQHLGPNVQSLIHEVQAKIYSFQADSQFQPPLPPNSPPRTPELMTFSNQTTSPRFVPARRPLSSNKWVPLSAISKKHPLATNKKAQQIGKSLLLQPSRDTSSDNLSRLSTAASIEGSIDEEIQEISEEMFLLTKIFKKDSKVLYQGQEAVITGCGKEQFEISQKGKTFTAYPSQLFSAPVVGQICLVKDKNDPEGGLFFASITGVKQLHPKENMHEIDLEWVQYKNMPQTVRVSTLNSLWPLGRKNALLESLHPTPVGCRINNKNVVGIGYYLKARD